MTVAVDNELEELRQLFIVEASEGLSNIESLFLELEKGTTNNAVIEQICRLAHNIKGSAGAIGFADLSAFAHQIENLLTKIMRGEISPNREHIDVLLQCNDRLKVILKHYADKSDKLVPTDDLIEKINGLISQSGTVQRPKNIGEILVEEKLATKEDVETAAKLQNRKIGEILVDKGVINQKQLEHSLHKQEEHNSRLGKKAEEYVRLPLAKIDSLLDALGEQAILESQIDQARQDLVKNQDVIHKTIMQLGKITYNLQQSALSLRMFALTSLFAKMQRLVRDTAKQVNKEINFQIKGDSLELDKSILDEISSPLTHLIRNAIDHGIETEEERAACGKPKCGIVSLTAHTHSGFFYIEVRDDGKGLDKEKILAKAIEKNIVTTSDEMTDKEIYSLIFRSDFSTKENVTDISGRGVGMDVVKTFVTKLRGSIDINTKVGVGTTFTMKLPLTLSIFNGMAIGIGGQTFIVANSDVKEIMPVIAGKTHFIDKSEQIIKLKNRVMPFVELRKLLRLQGGPSEVDGAKNLALVVESDGREFALKIDNIFHQQRVVLKKLGEEINGLPGISGGTILPDGSVALILDMASIIQMVKSNDRRS